MPQNRLQVAGNQSVTEEQVLKGSCPFLYAWDGEKYEFVTDLLWGAPIGLPAALGVWASSDPSELVRIDGLVVDDGKVKIRVTEELWKPPSSTISNCGWSTTRKTSRPPATCGWCPARPATKECCC